MDRVDIFCDGACSGNPGPGGYGCIVRQNGNERELSGGDPLTTNNRMELMAAITALDSLKAPSKVILTTDSQYLTRGMTEWLEGWQENGWRNANKKPVLNRDLWERLVKLDNRHDIKWVWIRGHAGHTENEMCDALAKAAIASRKL